MKLSITCQKGGAKGRWLRKRAGLNYLLTAKGSVHPLIPDIKVCTQKEARRDKLEYRAISHRKDSSPEKSSWRNVCLPVELECS